MNNDTTTLKASIKEMFPHVTSDEIDILFETNNDINIIITKILDGSYKGLKLNLNELITKQKHQPVISKKLYFPELFDTSLPVDYGEVDRKETEAIYSKIQEYKKKKDITANNLILGYYNEKIADLHVKLDALNRKRALNILKKSIQTPDMIDLHGLYTKEALMFVSDYIEMYNPKKLNLITGSDGNSQSLRPSVINFLRKKKYEVLEDTGPYIYASKLQ